MGGVPRVIGGHSSETSPTLSNETVPGTRFSGFQDLVAAWYEPLESNGGGALSVTPVTPVARGARPQASGGGGR